jgi:hypothetical protein
LLAICLSCSESAVMSCIYTYWTGNVLGSPAGLGSMTS